MNQIYILPDTHERHVLMLYAGLYELAADEGFRIRCLERPGERSRAWHGYSLWIEVQQPDRGGGVRICFDMADTAKIASTDGLEKCDVYFKRSYSADTVEGLEPALRRKVRPFGLYCFLVGREDRHLLRRLRIERRIKKSLGIPFRSIDAKHHLNLFLSRYCRAAARGRIRRTLYPTADEWEAAPQKKLSGTILFQTRVWPAERVPQEKEVHELNEMRAATVRALKSRFGERFLGGLVPDPYARDHYPDCVTRERVDRRSYLALVRGAQIGVVTHGVHRSIPSKLAEYLAASRCIVAEPPARVLPDPLRPGLNYLPFTTPEECVRACERLLSDEELSRGMQKSNLEYYSSHVAPARTMKRCLETAMDEPPGEPWSER